MSVTFRASNITYSHRVQDCSCCEGTGKWHESEDCPYCQGTGKESVMEPAEGFTELNVSNVNATMLLKAVAPEFDYSQDACGEFSGTVLDRVYTRCMSMLNGDVTRLTRDSEQQGNFYFCGVDEGRARRYLSGLLEVIKQARRNGASVIFS